MFIQFNEVKMVLDDNYNKVSLTCPNCSSLVKSSDKKYFDKYSCCEVCSEFFAHPNKEKWFQGWRPSKAEINRKLKNKSLEPTYIMRGLKC